jgi:hypothetical protein
MSNMPRDAFECGDQVETLGVRQVELRHPLAKRRTNLQPGPVQRPIVAIRKIAHRRDALLRTVDRHVPQLLAFMQREILRDAQFRNAAQIVDERGSEILESRAFDHLLSERLGLQNCRVGIIGQRVRQSRFFDNQFHGGIETRCRQDLTGRAGSSERGDNRNGRPGPRSLRIYAGVPPNCLDGPRPRRHGRLFLPDIRARRENERTRSRLPLTRVLSVAALHRGPIPE